MKFSTLILTGLFLFTSCELVDVVDQPPPNNLVPENVAKDADGAEELLTGAYATLHDQYYYMFTETTPGLLSGSMDRGGFLSDLEISENAVSIENNNIGSYWEAFYSLLDAANTVIDLVGEIPDEEFAVNRKQEIIAEARALRAMALFDALRYFGQFYDRDSPLGVVIRTESIDFTTRDKGREPVAAVYDQIIQDLDAAIQHAPDLTVPYYMSKTAAKALKARVLLFMGEYEGAASLADEVISDNTRELAPTFEEVFSGGFNSEEMIFMRYTDEVSYNSDRKQYTYGFGYALAGEWLRDMMDEDPRATASYDTSNSNILKVNNTDFFSPTYFVRLAEVYLIKAEALTRSEAPLAECKEPLEAIRTRALGTPYTSPATTHEELLDEIFEEIVMELAFENGSDWFATIRFDKIMDLKPEVTSVNQYILPIPQTEMDGNMALTEQNPGYTQ